MLSLPSTGSSSRQQERTYTEKTLNCWEAPEQRTTSWLVGWLIYAIYGAATDREGINLTLPPLLSVEALSQPDDDGDDDKLGVL